LINSPKVSLSSLLQKERERRHNKLFVKGTERTYVRAGIKTQELLKQLIVSKGFICFKMIATIQKRSSKMDTNVGSRQFMG